MTENRKNKAVPLVLSILCLMSVTVVFTNPVYLRKKSSEITFPVITEITTSGEIKAETTSSTTTRATISVTTSVSYSETTSATTSATISAPTSALFSATTSATTSSLSSATTSATDTKTTYARTSAKTLAKTSATIVATKSATTSSLSSATTFVPASTTISAANPATASATSSETTSPITSATTSATSSVTILATTSAITSSTFSATTLATTLEVTTWAAVDATEAETSPATTSSEITNPCFGHDCGGLTCFPIDDSAHCFDPLIQKIGFLTYDRNMTVKCANGNSDGKLITKHECLDKSANCEVDQVKIHMQFFEATPNKNEYYINTHGDTQRAMYHKNENENGAGWVVQIEVDHDPDWKLGSTWIIEKIECNEEKCPVIVRAGEIPHKGWKRDHSDRDSPYLAFDTIDKNNEDFWWFIELQ